LEDKYETAMVDLINRKKAGQQIPKGKAREQNNVIDLMDALRRSLGKDVKSSNADKPAKAKKAGKRATGQTEMLLPISGKAAASHQAKQGKAQAKKPTHASRRKKAS
jgi:DNA end-binding protein Ku